LFDHRDDVGLNHRGQVSPRAARDGDAGAPVSESAEIERREHHAQAMLDWQRLVHGEIVHVPEHELDHRLEVPLLHVTLSGRLDQLFHRAGQDTVPECFHELMQLGLFEGDDRGLHQVMHLLATPNSRQQVILHVLTFASVSPGKS
jgi:hypothetical protein